MEELKNQNETGRCSALKMYQDHLQKFSKSVISRAPHPHEDSEASKSGGSGVSALVHVCGLSGTAASQANVANKARQWEERTGRTVRVRETGWTTRTPTPFFFFFELRVPSSFKQR